jgi:hypothetical protein
LFQNILSILLVTAFFNVVIAKSMHEFFEHEHEHEHESDYCADKNLNHFHQHEFAHLDFICDFNFSSSLSAKKSIETKEVVRHYERQLKVKYLWLIKNIFLDVLSARGPPMIE